MHRRRIVRLDEKVESRDPREGDGDQHRGGEPVPYVKQKNRRAGKQQQGRPGSHSQVKEVGGLEQHEQQADDPRQDAPGAIQLEKDKAKAACRNGDRNIGRGETGRKAAVR